MRRSARRLALVSMFPITTASWLHAQQPASEAPRVPRAAPSTRATVAVILNGRMIGGSWSTNAPAVAGPARIEIDYGQPHARGRVIMGGLVPWDDVWRLGANEATHLHTDVDLTIGNAFVPRGSYTLFLLPGRTGWKLIINKQVFQWGEDYDASQDLARVDLQVRQLSEPTESLTVWLIPKRIPQDAVEPAQGVLKIAWERTELTTDWRVGR